MADLNILYETFELYLNKAKACVVEKNYAAAKKYYYVAAEQMLKLAQESTGELRKVRFARAKSVIEQADALEAPAPKRANAPAGENSASPSSSEPEEKLTLQQALAELDSLVGLGAVKRQVKAWIDLIEAFKIRRERDKKIPVMSYHLAFTGNPGTGKTTVARLMCHIYRELGIISKGHLVETDRSKLVEEHIGGTAIKTQKVIDSAIGGVLFIDEAYTLAGASANDFGKEAIETLLKAMEDSRSDFVVIAAGYEKPMERFINANAGLKSRFKTFINFEDYTGEELIRIFKGLCVKNDYIISPEAELCLVEYINYLYDNRSSTFGNGRDIRNLFEDIVTAQSRRIPRMVNPTDEQICTILPCDLPTLPAPRQKTTAPTPAPAPTYNAAPTPSAPSIPTSAAPVKPAPTETTEETPKPEDTVLKNKATEENSEFKFDWDKLPAIGFDDVAGLESVKETVRLKVLLPLQNPEAFEGYEKKSGGGLLMYGPPGTGKTMIAAAIANEIGAKFCSVKPSDLLHQGAGQSEKAIRALFAQARKYPCAVICFDEMDSISPKSTKSQYARQLRSEFLSQLQGVDSYSKENKNILFLIATTNKPWDIDSAFLRPGRFGTRVYIGLPDTPARDYMVRNRMEKIRKKGVVAVAGDIDYEAIVEKTEGFNGSDMSEMLDKIEENSILRSIKTGVKMIAQTDFDIILADMTSSVQKDDIENLLDWKKQNG